MINAVLINDTDTVVTTTSKILADSHVTFQQLGKSITIQSNSDIPKYHKVAIKDVKKGDAVLKYGEKIGLATQDIQVGDHVHTHNIGKLQA